MTFESDKRWQCPSRRRGACARPGRGHRRLWAGNLNLNPTEIVVTVGPAAAAEYLLVSSILNPSPSDPDGCDTGHPAVPEPPRLRRARAALLQGARRASCARAAARARTPCGAPVHCTGRARDLPMRLGLGQWPDLPGEVPGAGCRWLLPARASISASKSRSCH